jgi:hypothetical protein
VPTPISPITKMRVELDVTPWWWRTSEMDADLAGRAMAEVLASVPRIWRVTASMTYLSVSANMTPDVTLDGLEKKRAEVVRKLDALVPRKDSPQ